MRLPSVTCPDAWIIVDFPFYRILSGNKDGNISWRLSSEIKTIEKTDFGYEVVTTTGTLYGLKKETMGTTSTTLDLFKELNLLASQLGAKIDVVDIDKVMEEIK
mgnify:CR=1 FL=1